ncbi:MAG: hypothetical protein KZQ78_13320, partial [Candidatus Thiodiazotropha sp. (ex Ustalcina ferruginea)]|nr:hypothetical protein [Candidatus Thiodiazotropha sp. (ex Ustalcina ferruginea)]
FAAGEESLEVGLFEEYEIPWEKLAFPVIRESLQLYYADRKGGSFPLRGGTIIRTPESSKGYRIMLDSD